MDLREMPTGTRVKNIENKEIHGIIVQKPDRRASYPPTSEHHKNVGTLVLVDDGQWADDWMTSHKPYFCGMSAWELCDAVSTPNIGNTCPKCSSPKTGYTAMAMKCDDCWHTW